MRCNFIAILTYFSIILKNFDKNLYIFRRQR